jgi:hypothetical protein
MSSIRDEEELKVYNYSTSSIVLMGQNKHSYLIEGCVDGIPGVEFMTFRDIDYVNSHSPVIRTGAVQFDSDKQDEIYSALHISNWKNITLFENDIDNLIENPTKENMQRILDIPDAFTFERVRGHYIGLVNDHSKDISNRVVDVIEKRWDEIKFGKSKTEYVVKANGDSVKGGQKDAEIDALKTQVQSMKDMLSQMLSNGAVTANAVDSENESSAEVALDNAEVCTEKPVAKSTRGRKKVVSVK